MITTPMASYDSISFVFDGLSKDIEEDKNLMKDIMRRMRESGEELPMLTAEVKVRYVPLGQMFGIKL